MDRVLEQPPGKHVVMHVITNFTGNAGAETMLARLLGRTKHRTIVVPLIDVSERNRRMAENPIVSFEPLRCRSSGANAMLDLGRASLRLRNLIRTENPSTVVCWMYHAMVVGTIGFGLAGSRQKLFWNVRQSLDDLDALSSSTRLALAAAKRLSSRPSGIVYNSQRALDLHSAYGYKNQYSIVIPNGFPAQATSSPRSRAKVLGIAGRYHPQKDYDTFFRAARIVLQRHPTTRFIAVGKDVEATNAAVSRAVRDADLDAEAVELRGELSDVSPFYEEIDGLVLSSRTEGFPNVVAEAMVHGKPVVATDVGDAAAIIADTGFVCAPKDPPALAEAMCKLLELPSPQYLAMCQAARNRIRRHFSLSKISERYDRLFDGRGSAEPCA